MCEKKFQIYDVHISRKCIESRNFYLCPPSPLKTLCQVPIITPKAERNYSFPQGEFFSKIYFPQQQKGVEETVICFIRVQSKNMKMTWNVRLFTFCIHFVFYIIFNCGGFTVLSISII